jgi:hypothetical protein
LEFTSPINRKIDNDPLSEIDLKTSERDASPPFCLCILTSLFTSVLMDVRAANLDP